MDARGSMCYALGDSPRTKVSALVVLAMSRYRCAECRMITTQLVQCAIPECGRRVHEQCGTEVEYDGDSVLICMSCAEEMD